MVTVHKVGLSEIEQWWSLKQTPESLLSVSSFAGLPIQ